MKLLLPLRLVFFQLIVIEFKLSFVEYILGKDLIMFLVFSETLPFMYFG